MQPKLLFVTQFVPEAETATTYLVREDLIKCSGYRGYKSNKS